MPVIFTCCGLGFGTVSVGKEDATFGAVSVAEDVATSSVPVRSFMKRIPWLQFGPTSGQGCASQRLCE